MSERPSVLLVNQHYWPDHAATGQYLTDLGERLAADGFDVSVLCAQGQYQSGKLEAPAEEVHNGVHITRVKTTAFGRGTTMGRLADYASFYARVFRHVLFGRRYDSIIFLTTPPLVATVGALARRLRGVCYGIWSMDLHPDAEVALGMISENGLPARILHGLNNWSYRRADFVVALGPHMKRRILEKGVSPARAKTIPVWSWAKQIQPVSRETNPLRQDLRLGDTFVAMYSGNAGLAHQFEAVCETMKALRDDERIAFLFVGGGPRRAEIEAFADAEELTNVRFLEYFPREQLAESLSLGDAHLLTLRDDFAGIAAPSKLYGIMAAGRPTVMVGPEESEPAEVIRRHRTGEVIRSGPRAGVKLTETLLRMVEARDNAEAIGDRARRTFLSRYEQDVVCAQWTDLLRRTLGIPTPALPEPAREDIFIRQPEEAAAQPPA